jgi:methionyl-tRNA synthetase
MVSFDEWSKIDLRVGKIEEVEEIEGKDKLYKLQVSFGEEKRQVVAGLKEFYSIDELKGKKSVFVYNLDPIKLAGLDSNAMILAAKNNEDSYKVMFVDDSVEEGTKLE